MTAIFIIYYTLILGG